MDHIWGGWGKLCHFLHTVCCPLCEMNREMRGKLIQLIIFQAVSNELKCEGSVYNIGP